jgi:hypothetical protein
MKRCFWFLLVLPGLLASGQDLLPVTPSPAGLRRGRLAEAQNPAGWFRRAYDETNLRMPGSAPFEMTVTFHAYPGIDFAPKGKSPIVSGDGTYQETWVSPHDWRREITLGGYHAVEVEADGVRKFQASSDYEPSRVLMMLRALLDPVQRSYLEPELQQRRIHWTLKHLKLGTIPYVRIEYNGGSAIHGPNDFIYDFLPNGILFRYEAGYSGLVTSWEDDESFAGKLVPRRITVQGDGLKSPMLTAEVAIKGIGARVPVIRQLPGTAADACATLRPIDHFDKPGKMLHLQIPEAANSYPVGTMTTVLAVVDRQGKSHEAELSSIRVYGQPPRGDQIPAVWAMADHLVKAAMANRWRAPTVDGKPCEQRVGISQYDSPNPEVN